MFCFGRERVREEKNLFRIAEQTPCDSISRRNSIFKSFLEDLCFWESSRFYSLQGTIKRDKKNSRSHRIVFEKRQNKIPTLKEAIETDNEYQQLTNITTSSTRTLWGTQIYSESGNNNSHDSIQWKKVCGDKF